VPFVVAIMIALSASIFSAAPALASEVNVQLTTTGVAGEGAPAVLETFDLADPISAATGAATFQFTLPAPYTSVGTAAYMQINNNAADPGTGEFTTAWGLNTVETDPANAVWTATGRSDVPAGTYQALVRATTGDDASGYIIGTWNFTIVLTDGGATSTSLPLTNAIAETKSVQVGANSVPTSTTVRYIAPTGYNLTGAQVELSLYSADGHWETICTYSRPCLANADLNAVTANDGSAVDITVPSLAALKAALGNPAAPENTIKLDVNINVDNPTPDLRHVTFMFETTFTSTTGSGGGGAGGGGFPIATTSGTVTAGGSLSSDPSGAVPNASNPLVVTLTSPVAGSVTIGKATGVFYLPTPGYFSVGVESTITAPPSVPSQPLRLALAYYTPGARAGTYPSDITMFYQHSPVSRCVGQNVATPDPCVASVTLTDGIMTQTVLTSHAGGNWDLETPQVGRLAGVDRYGTAIASSQAEFPSGGAGGIVLARGDDYPDALVGTPLAAAKNAPLLLTSGPTLPTAVATEIRRVLPAGHAVYLLGGINAIPQSVADELERMGYSVVRYGGSNRYATAIQVADALGDPATVLLATGTNFPDALAAGVAAAKTACTVLLTDGDHLPPETAGYLKRNGTTVYAIGGPATAADPDATAVAGSDRYVTAVDVAQTFFTNPTGVGVATGIGFADALSSGALLAHAGAPLLLAQTTSVPQPVLDYLTGLKAAVIAHVFGGDTALSPTVQSAIGAVLHPYN